MKSMLKSLALKVPQIKRLRDETRAAWQRVEELGEQNHALHVQLDQSLEREVLNYSQAAEEQESRRIYEELLKAQERIAELEASHEALAMARDKEVDILQCEILSRTDALARVETQHQQTRSTSAQLEQFMFGINSSIDSSLRSIRLAIEGRGPSGAGSGGIGARWLDLLEDVLTGIVTKDEPFSPWSEGQFSTAARLVGEDWPHSALTMIGTARMRHLRGICEMLIQEGVPGDFVEAGVWRGGACIYMRAIIEALEQSSRRVFVADSFAGLPPPDPVNYPQDDGDLHFEVSELSVSLEEVRDNFKRFGLLDDQVVFVPGWFKDTLHKIDTDRIALLRLDGDMYESTIQGLDALYNKVVPGGVVVIDDYVLEPCAQAVVEFRSKHGINAPLQSIDRAAVWWRVPN